MSEFGAKIERSRNKRNSTAALAAALLSSPEGAGKFEIKDTDPVKSELKPVEKPQNPKE